ncbi:extracellular calcium-sensing receptor-like [Pleurodeles waltl]|uniref:extracellular calcium-sensing receptor-like n=1 Tax=Pleurodeles waltl TaxID=8319 RepID=UPI003709B1C6
MEEQNEDVQIHCVAQHLVPECHLQRNTVKGLSRDGDILVGGTFAIHDAREYESLNFKEKPERISCQTFMFDDFQWFQAMVFAIDEVNRNPSLLPNITLGFRIHDSCMVIQRAIEGTLWILTGQEEPIPNYQCLGNRLPVAIIGDVTSTRSILMAQILSLYRHPQISYSASSPLLSDRNKFPSFFRTVPSDDFQSRGLAQLVIYFGWTWVGLLADDDDYGQQGIKLLQDELTKAGACVAFSKNIVTSRADKNAFDIAQMIKKSSANAIVIFSNGGNMVVLMEELVKQNVTGKIFVATEGWSSSALLLVEKYSEILTGTIGFEIHSGEMPGFEEYLTNLHPSSTRDHMLLQEFWEDTFSCKFYQAEEESLNEYHNLTVLCTGAEKLEKQHVNPSGATSFGLPYKIYNAVYAIALALQDLSFCSMTGAPFSQGTCLDIMGFQPWQLLRYIKNVRLQEHGGKGAFFDEHGNPPAQYDVINWQRSQEGRLRPVKVGTYDSSAPAGETLNINISSVRWNGGDTKVPDSVCSPICSPGFRKVAKEEEPACCFLCVPCPQGAISNNTDSIDCTKCSWDQWPNQKQDSCILKIIEFLHYEEPLGATLTATSILSSILPVTILGLFVYYRNTPIVRANNRALSFILLLCLTLCFLCSLAFIGYPSQEKCLLRQVAFSITFALCVSCILAKTIMVVIAFNATKPNSNLRKWVGPQLSYIVVNVCTLIQVLFCIFWLILAPPFTEYNIISKPGMIVLECNEGSSIAFWGMLGYLGLLATISFIVAFLARKLPASFNEAKFITFSMLAFLTVWLSFIPAYLSTQGKYMVAMEIFAILSSSSSLVFCIFFPKCYIILFRSEINTKEYLMGRETAKIQS